MKRIRLQFLLLLMAVVLLFGGVLLLDFLAFGQKDKLQLLESRVASVLQDWNLMVTQSMGLLVSAEPAEAVYAEWDAAWKAYRAAWPGQMAELDALAGGDASLLDRLGWIRNTLRLGMEQLENLSSSLDDLMAQLRGKARPGDLPLNIASLVDANPAKPATDPVTMYYFFHLRSGARILGTIMGPVLNSAQLRFQRELREQVGLLNERFMQIRLAALGLLLAVLAVFLLRINKLNLDLFSLVNQRTADLDRTLRHLRDTQDSLLESRRQAAMSSLIIGISHEINTPLGILLTAVSKMRHNHQDLSGLSTRQELTRQFFSEYLDQQEELLDLSETNIGRMRGMINYFRNLSVEQHNLEYHEIDLVEEMALWLPVIGAELARHGLSLETETAGAGRVTTCPGVLVEVIRHLVSNSIEFAYPDGRAGTVRIAIRRLDDGIEIIHEDDGVGIPAEVADRVFEPFFTTGRATGHMGLGLNIVHNLVTRLLGGSIRFEQPQRGTRVVIRLPLSFDNP